MNRKNMYAEFGSKQELFEAALDHRSARFVDEYLARLDAGFRNAPENAQENGDIPQSANVKDLSAHFVNAGVGISVLLRAKAAPEQMYVASRGVTSVL